MTTQFVKKVTVGWLTKRTTRRTKMYFWKKEFCWRVLLRETREKRRGRHEEDETEKRKEWKKNHTIQSVKRGMMIKKGQKDRTKYKWKKRWKKEWEKSLSFVVIVNFHTFLTRDGRKETNYTNCLLNWWQDMFVTTISGHSWWEETHRTRGW